LKRLLAGNAWKVVENLIEREAGLKVVDQGVDGNASARKHRCAAYDFRVDGYWKAFDFFLSSTSVIAVWFLSRGVYNTL